MATNRRIRNLAGWMLAGTLMLAGCGKPYYADVPVQGDQYSGNGIGTLPSLPTATVQGKVEDTRTGMGIPGVRVSVDNTTPPISTLTAPDGSYTLEQVPKGTYKLSVDVAGYTISSQGDVVVTIPDGVPELTAPTIMLVPAINSLPNAFLTAIGNLNHPEGIALDPNSDDIYVVDKEAKYIPPTTIPWLWVWGVRRFNKFGGFQQAFGAAIFMNDLDYPEGVAVDKGGDLWVTDSHASTIREYGNGNLILPADNGSNFPGLSKPYSIAVTSYGQMWVANPGTGQINLYNVDRSPASVDGTGAPVAPVMCSNSVAGIALDANDDLYVIDPGDATGRVVKKYDPSGHTLLDAFGYMNGNGAGYFENPTHLAVDNRNGDLYVVDAGNNRIQHFGDRDGHYTYLSEFGGMGSANGQLNNPYDIAIDKDGFIYVSDTQNNRIEKFAPGQNQTGPTSTGTTATPAQ